MLRNQRKGFVSGVLIATLIFTMLGTALAAYQKQATLDYVGIKITLDGTEIIPKDANGNVVEPFAIEGTTYLPVRGIANALGLGVSWDGATQTVVLSSPGKTAGTGGQTAGAVIMDKNGIKITYLGVGPNAIRKDVYEIKLKIENGASKDYTVQIRDLSLNEIMLNTSVFSSSVVAGKTANDGISLYGLEAAGIDLPIETAEFYFHIFNRDDWMDSFDSEVITIRP